MSGGSVSLVDEAVREARPPRAATRLAPRGGGGNSPLVIDTVSVAKVGAALLPEGAETGDGAGNPGATRAERYALQDAARSLLPEHRVGVCMREVGRSCDRVVVRYSASQERASFAGLAVCGSLWACPVCAARVAEERAGKVRAALGELHKRGGTAAFVTLTVSHAHGDSLEKVLGGFLAALRAMQGWRAYKALKEAYSVLGTIRVLEVTHGRNGWHPHAHMLFFLDGAFDELALAGLEDALFPLWERAAVKQGLTMSRRYGLQVKLSYGAVEEYIAKFGRGPRWDVAGELTKGHIKRGRSLAGQRSLTPWDLLALAAAGDARCGLLFREFVEKFAGKAQLYWSPGLSTALLPDWQERSDEEAAAAAAASDAVDVGQVAPSAWVSVLRDRGRVKLLELVEGAGGGWELAAAYIEEVCRRYPPYQRRDLLAVSPELRAQLDQLHAEQRERNRWRGPVALAAEVA